MEHYSTTWKNPYTNTPSKKTEKLLLELLELLELLRLLIVLAGGLVVLVVDGAVEAAVIAKLAHVVHQLAGLQVHALAAQDLQRVGEAQALLLVVAAARVRLVNL